MGATLDGRTLREAMARYLEAFRDHRQAFPALEVEVHLGGQPNYPLLIGLE
jgi:hypothetical protein